MIHSLAISTCCLGFACPVSFGQATNAGPKLARDPFWPVGYTPPPPVVGGERVERIDKPVKWPQLRLKGLTRGAKGVYLAVVEDVGGLVEPGSVIAKEQDGLLYRWEVKEISDKGLTCVPLDVRPAGAKEKPAPKENKEASP
jgi:hypothetical protein